MLHNKQFVKISNSPQIYYFFRQLLIQTDNRPMLRFATPTAAAVRRSMHAPAIALVFKSV